MKFQPVISQESVDIDLEDIYMDEPSPLKLILAVWEHFHIIFCASILRDVVIMTSSAATIAYTEGCLTTHHGWKQIEVFMLKSV